MALEGPPRAIRFAIEIEYDPRDLAPVGTASASSTR
jgi:hypothetical protein